ncbi:transcriptional regulator [Luteimonas chenhongjianii]|uniref:Transcriptional regulator n=1 Tax=Luteimonas chenhongjianii TaxID=2006110 RepID=A0A290XG93_9GAMM|nr:helix-turn-helix transcriptional regulator [Luteimonas chenhongjianii]ATD68150.1 transcriptional regulator [Luteimonas chenhongjianii]
MSKKTIDRPEYRELVGRLRTLREESGKSQTELARLLGWPQQRLSAIEAGARRLDIIEFVELAVALGACPSALIRIVAVPTHQRGQSPTD